MKIILLAGGKGTRLWPASTDEIPKQFLKIYKNETMIEKIYNSLLSLYDKNDIYIATTNEYKTNLENILNNFNNYIIEPKSNGTYSAILNIGAYLKFEKNIFDDEQICILPIDSNVNENFFKIFKNIEKKYKNSTSICLIGIKPNDISCNYGYIIHNNDKVIYFKEKPNYKEAIDLINNGALWNSGIFIAKLSKFFSYLKKYNINNYKELLDNYMNIQNGSFDKIILENEKNIFVITSKYKWSDIGIWENLSPLISNNDQYNTNIINYENKKIINNGVKDAIVINSKNGIKLINKNKKNVVIKDWGYYEILNEYIGNCYIKIKKLTIFPNCNISYQYHQHRCEEWIILSGSGKIILNEKEKNIKGGDKISINVCDKHMIMAHTLLEIIELQYGDCCDEEDIVRIAK